MNAIEKAFGQSVSNLEAFDRSTIVEIKIPRNKSGDEHSQSELFSNDIVDPAQLSSDDREVAHIDFSSTQELHNYTSRAQFVDIDWQDEYIPEEATVNNSERSLSTTTYNFLDLPKKKMKELGFISLDHPRTQIAEEYRQIKRPIIENIEKIDSSHSNIIMVTSSIASEGKTFTAINLALSMTMERNKNVVLVDSDPARGSVGSILGLPEKALGVIDLLNGKVDGLEDIVYQTSVPNLAFVPVGDNHQHSTELLASERMRLLVRELSQDRADRIVLLDAPPMLPTTEAKVIAGLAGQIVFVVESDRTSQTMVSEALSYIPAEKSVGLILNKTKNKIGPSYGYNYNYGKENSAVRRK